MSFMVMGHNGGAASMAGRHVSVGVSDDLEGGWKKITSIAVTSGGDSEGLANWNVSSSSRGQTSSSRGCHEVGWADMRKRIEP